MKYNLLLFAVVLISYSLSAQKNCDQNELSLRPGKYKEGLKSPVGSIPAKESAAELATLGKIYDMIKTGYHPVGMVAIHSIIVDYNAAIGSNWIANPFACVLAMKKFTCINGKEYANGEAQVDCFGSVVIYANSMEWITNIYASGLEKENENGYVYLKDRPVEKDGIYYFKLADTKTGKFEAAMITKNGSLPFEYVSQKEFLQTRKIKLEKSKPIQLAMVYKKHVIRPKAEQDAALQKELALLKKENYTQPYIDRFIKDYKTDEQKREADINRVEKYYNVPLNLIDQLLNKSVGNELSKPAIISAQDVFDTFSGFVTDAKGTYLVKPNLSYFNKALPKSAPQFFTVFYNWNDKDPEYDKANSGLKKGIDYQVLKNMLPK
jgi:hypothetical protein